MSRLAGSAIKGFVYQFHKTLEIILNSSPDDLVTVEGVIEDIDVDAEDGTCTAIQCKYHEAASGYSPSLIFKPLLLMAEHFSKNPQLGVKYHIFMHVPGLAPEVRAITGAEIDSALSTTDANLTKIVARIHPAFSKEMFIDVSTIEFGVSLSELEMSVKQLLAVADIPTADVATVLYPNAINRIANLAVLQATLERTITRNQLIAELRQTNQTAISHWTLALRNRAEILKQKREQLRHSLSQNSRDRRFFFEPNQIDQFFDGIVTFLTDFVSKYNSKRAHTKTPIVAISASRDLIADVEERLYKKGVVVSNGLIGASIDPEHFFREPMKSTSFLGGQKREFNLRLVPSGEDVEIFTHRRGDDVFVIANQPPQNLDLTDVNVYMVGVKTFQELSYIIGLASAYE